MYVTYPFLVGKKRKRDVKYPQIIFVSAVEKLGQDGQDFRDIFFSINKL